MSLATFATIAEILGTAASTGVTVYGALETIDIAKEQAELTLDLTRQKADLEEEIARSQLRIYEMQSENVIREGEISADIAALRAKSLEEQMNRLKILEEKRLEIDLKRLELEESKIDFENDLQDILEEQRLQEVQTLIEPLGTTSPSGSSSSSAGGYSGGYSGGSGGGSVSGESEAEESETIFDEVIEDQPKNNNALLIGGVVILGAIFLVSQSGKKK